ncbi:hypothetical protein SCOCK_370024 [Actinacidiphila cocklensis]|uniref:Uncharacterized protein n=1 Tax=Actinacidiphila cocklensis TaxID=887465 RepID=A0A9W4GTJ9_9ACTN|nr:hypothetical protein SCOCK_370024 [Actinacidiphila cocklensis]
MGRRIGAPGLATLAVVIEPAAGGAPRHGASGTGTWDANLLAWGEGSAVSAWALHGQPRQRGPASREPR